MLDITLLRKDRVKETHGFSKLPHALDRPNLLDRPDIVFPEGWLV